MAIIFDKEVSQTDLLNSHNNNIVEFHSDNALAETSCNVDWGSVSFDITPDPTGKFTYNLKEVITSLINASNFKDKVVPAMSSASGTNDSSLYLEVSITFKVSFTGGSTESIARNYKFLKSVVQPIKYANNKISPTTDKIALLMPLMGRLRKIHFAPWYDGRPFDFSLYSNGTRTITVNNKTMNQTSNFDVTKGVNRIYVSQGSKDWVVDNILPLRFGINQLEIFDQSSPGDFVTLYLDRKEDSCGLYYRYYNNAGGYSYLRSNKIYTENSKTKTIATLAPVFADIDSSFESDVISGKEATRTLNHLIEIYNKQEVNYLKEIIHSPRVDLCLNEPYENTSLDSWLGIRVLDGTYQTENTKNNFANLKFKAGITLNTLSLV